MPRKPEPDENRQANNIAVLIAVIVLIALAAWLLIEFRHGTDLLDCYARGRKNCTSTPVWPPAPS